MIPVMTSFLPPDGTDQYLPVLFKLWEAFNSAVIDERMVAFCGRLSEEYMLAQPSNSSISWQDVGIWSQKEWDLITNKGLGFMSKYQVFVLMT
jgi:proteasome activator subunit 4